MNWSLVVGLATVKAAASRRTPRWPWSPDAEGGAGAVGAMNWSLVVGLATVKAAASRRTPHWPWSTDAEISLTRSDLRPQYDHGARAGAIYITRNRSGGVPCGNIVGRIKGSIDPATPGIVLAGIETREFEIEGLPIGIENIEVMEIFPGQIEAEGQGMRVRAPIGLMEFDAMPFFLRLTEKFNQGQALHFRSEIPH